ncbi:MAG: AAA family ATPase [Candidatus Methanomethylophilaceae archaeon]|nr:AAA family ATPase [Candidatus Methanomethylophilaceae archaeon]
MNIQEAKDCIRDAITSYLSHDENGDYSIPRSKQRPLVIMGAPGLGKTAIMSQVAAELGIGYVGYAMTHHTRQSAIGLPMIEKAIYGGTEEAVTRYTMSEIVASVYDEMERSGHREGILFIDEVNCVSETLAAAMLDLLQNKKLGPHRIPDGWILTAAGNPPEYNESARELDVATSDRVRLIEVEPDADVWLRYAAGAGVHDAVRYYLSVKPGSLMSMERTPGGYRFATPRSWEDLSAVLKEHDRIGLPVGIPLISQYIRDPDIAAEFKRYLDFHRRYGKEHDVGSILDGAAHGSSLENADAEERLSVISMIVGRLNSEAEEGLCLEALMSLLDSYGGEDPEEWLRRSGEELSRKLSSPTTGDVAKSSSFCINALKGLDRTRDGIVKAKSEATARGVAHQRSFDARLDNAMTFMEGSGRHGAVQLLSSLLGCYSVVMYSRPGGPLYRYNDELLSDGRDKRITDAMEAWDDAAHRISEDRRRGRDYQDNVGRQGC